MQQVELHESCSGCSRHAGSSCCRETLGSQQSLLHSFSSISPGTEQAFPVTGLLCAVTTPVTSYKSESACVEVNIFAMLQVPCTPLQASSCADSSWMEPSQG